jgi:hypothetical protein
MSTWTIQYWPKGQTRAQATVMDHKRMTYNEARKAARQCRYIPAFFGNVIEPVRIYPEGDDADT